MLMCAADRFIGELISNVVLSTREKHWLLREANVFWGKRKKSVALWGGPPVALL